jgi:hypothetical protein
MNSNINKHLTILFFPRKLISTNMLIVQIMFLKDQTHIYMIGFGRKWFHLKKQTLTLLKNSRVVYEMCNNRQIHYILACVFI